MPIIQTINVRKIESEIKDVGLSRSELLIEIKRIVMSMLSYYTERYPYVEFLVLSDHEYSPHPELNPLVKNAKLVCMERDSTITSKKTDGVVIQGNPWAYDNYYCGWIGHAPEYIHYMTEEAIHKNSQKDYLWITIFEILTIDVFVPTLNNKEASLFLEKVENS